MLRSLELENYRVFRRYQLSGLARVNLLVGKNNSGKTSILEAVHLLASRGDTNVLAKLAEQRGEAAFFRDDRSPDGGGVHPIVAHFFADHKFGEGASFALRSGDSLGDLSVSVQNVSGEQNVNLRLSFVPAYVIQIQWGSGNSVKFAPSFPVNEDGALPLGHAQFLHQMNWRNGGSTPVQSVGAESLGRDELADMWNHVVIGSQEREVIQTLRLIAPGLDSLFFLNIGGSSYKNEKMGILVGFEGGGPRTPLASQGEGMRRLLALALSLAKAKGGILLIDEIDTGLHYSIMGDIWLLIVQAAIKYGVQVFATTHSWDCVRGLAWLCDNYPDLGAEVSLQTIEPRLSESIPLDAEKIIIAVDQRIEVR